MYPPAPARATVIFGEAEDEEVELDINRRVKVLTH
jgi:hypothetical protein